MRIVTGVACSIAAVLAMTACGGSAVPPTGQSQPAVFPVTITRTGGVAGFHDVLVVDGDGEVSVTRKGQQSRRCRLTPEVIKKVTAATSLVSWSRITPAAPQASFPDDLVTTMQSRAGGPVRLEDPRAGSAGQVFLDLLNDLSRGPTASRMCRTP